MSLVLLIEDEPKLANYMNQLFKKIDWICDSVNNAIEACNLNPEVYNFILTDYTLPVIDGIRYAKLIKEKYKQSPPIVIYNTEINIELFQKSKDAGVIGLIQKPIENIYIFKNICNELKKDNKSITLDRYMSYKGLNTKK